MDRTQVTRINPRVLSPALAMVFAFAAQIPALHAQTADRYAVLVPAFQPEAGARGNFGRDAAREFTRLLAQFPNHKPVDQGELRDALRKYSLKEEDLGRQECLFGIQLAVQINIPLVLCGTFQGTNGAYTINARVNSPQVLESYTMDPITAANPREAAQKLSHEFQEFVDNLRVAVFCQDYVSNQTWPDAVTNCQRAVQLNPQNKGAAFNLAFAHFRSNQPELAKEQLRKVLELDELHQDAMQLLGVIYAQQDSTERAMHHFREYLQLNPGDINTRLTIANDAATAGGPEAALRVVEDGMSSVTGEDLLRLQEIAGGYAMNAALKKLQESSGTVTDESRTLIEKGVNYLEQVNRTSGDETDVSIIRNLLTGYRLLDRIPEAEAFGAAAVAKPNYASDAALWSTYADVLNAAGRRQEALATLDKVAQLDPAYPLVHTRRATWLVAEGNLDAVTRAIQQGRQAGEITDDMVDAFAQQIAYSGYQKYAAGERQAADQHFNVADQLAISDKARGMAAFFRGTAIYNAAIQLEKAETLESACAALPMFRGVQALMRTARAYTADDARLEPNRVQLLEFSGTYIQRQEIIIRNRGRGQGCR